MNEKTFRSYLSNCILRSDSVISAGRMNSFCDQMFSNSETISVDQLCEILKATEETTLNKFLNDEKVNSKNDTSSDYPTLKLFTKGTKQELESLQSVIIEEEPSLGWEIRMTYAISRLK